MAWDENEKPPIMEVPPQQEERRTERSRTQMFGEEEMWYILYSSSQGRKGSPLYASKHRSSRKYPTQMEDSESLYETDLNICLAVEGLNHPVKRESEGSDEFHARVAASYRLKDQPTQSTITL
jgi:hypothetical protein